jgi:hypothetical protein
VNGILILAPEFLPTKVIVVVTIVVPEGKISFKLVDVKVNEVPICEILKGTPDVVGVGVKLGKAVVLTPVPVKLPIKFWFETVAK